MKKRFFLFAVQFLLIEGMSGAVGFENTPKMSVKGEASVFKPSDQMEVSLGVVTTAENSNQALNENNQHMRQVISNLKEIGLDESDYQTGRFHIRPIYQKPPKGSEEDEHAIISRYEVINSIKIKTQKVALADKILNSAVEGGANQIEQVNFNLINPQAYRSEAIKLATEHALADATALANAAGVRLVRVLDLSLDQWHHFPQPLMLAKRGDMLHREEGQQVMEPGLAEIHALVNVTMEIGQ
jgi:uncharacterized protein YggE